VGKNLNFIISSPETNNSSPPVRYPYPTMYRKQNSVLQYTLEFESSAQL